MQYKSIAFNSEFIAGFSKQSDFVKYCEGNEHWGLTKEEAKELHSLCKKKHKKDSPLAGDSEVQEEV